MIKHNFIKVLLIALASMFFVACGNSGDDTQTKAINKFVEYANTKGTSEAPTLQDYIDAGIEGMTEAKVADVNEVISNLTEEEVDTQEEIQALLKETGTTVVTPKAKSPVTPTVTPTSDPVTPTSDPVTPTPDPEVPTPDPVAKTLTKKVAIVGTYLATCDHHTLKTGKDTNFNNVLDDTEVTSEEIVLPQGEPITLVALKDKISNSEDVTKANTCQITNMRYMFYNASSFNQNIGAWNTAAVTDMSNMFTNASSFNQNIGAWNTAAVTTMSNMFYNASSFNQDIGAWNTAAVTDMGFMFYNASSFNQDISAWNVVKVSSYFNFKNNAPLTDAHTPKFPPTP